MRRSCLLHPCISLVLLALPACNDGRGAPIFAGPCEELLACCTELAPEAKSQCEDAYQGYRDADGAEQQCQAALESSRSTGFCADTPGSIDGSVHTDDGAVDGSSDVPLTVLSYAPNEQKVRVRVINGTSAELGVDQTKFSLWLESGEALPGDATYYEDSCRVTIVPGARTECAVKFWAVKESSFVEGERIVFEYPGGSSHATIPETLHCAGGIEGTAAACADGCDNDGDGFVDCDDRDCCGWALGCSTDTYCGRNASRYEDSYAACRDNQDNDGDGRVDCADFDCDVHCRCIKGSEDSFAACTDGCNNDGDMESWIDCNDRDCCPALADYACPLDTFCGGQ